MRLHSLLLVTLQCLFLVLACKPRNIRNGLSEGVAVGPDAEVFAFVKRDVNIQVRKCTDRTVLETSTDIDKKCPEREGFVKYIPERYVNARLANMLFVPSLKSVRDQSEFKSMPQQSLVDDLVEQINTLQNFKKYAGKALGKYETELNSLEEKLKATGFDEATVKKFNEEITKAINNIVANSDKPSVYNTSVPEQALMASMLRSLYSESPDLESWQKSQLIESNTVVPSGKVMFEWQPYELADGKVLYVETVGPKGALKDSKGCNSKLKIYDPAQRSVVRISNLPDSALECKTLEYLWAGADKIILLHTNRKDALWVIGANNRVETLRFP